MSTNHKLNLLAASLVVSVAGVSVGHAAANPFASADVSGGYQQLASHAEGKCGEGKCGEGKCGEDMSTTEPSADGKSGASHEDAKSAEGKCGAEKSVEGRCGEDDGTRKK